MHTLMLPPGLPSQALPPPSLLAGRLRHLLASIARATAGLSIDAWPGVWEVLLRHTQPADADAAGACVPPGCRQCVPPRFRGGGGGAGGERSTSQGACCIQPVRWLSPQAQRPAPIGVRAEGSGADGGSGGGGGMVASYASWLLVHAIKDVDGRGAMYAPGIKAFTAVQVAGLWARGGGKAAAWLATYMQQGFSGRRASRLPASDPAQGDAGQLHRMASLAELRELMQVGAWRAPAACHSLQQGGGQLCWRWRCMLDLLSWRCIDARPSSKAWPPQQPCALRLHSHPPPPVPPLPAARAAVWAGCCPLPGLRGGPGGGRVHGRPG